MERPSLDSFILSPIQRKDRKKLNTESLFENLRGEDGKDGISVVNAAINESGELVLTLSNEKDINVGKVRGEDGEDGDDGDTPELDIVDIVNRVLALIPEPEPVDTDSLKETIVSSIPQKTAQDLLKEIQEQGLKFPLSAIEDLETLIENAKKETKEHTDKRVNSIRMTGGNTNIRLKNSGSPVGQIETFNFIGATITPVGDGREVNVSFPGGGGSFAVLTPVSGSVDGSNTVFTFASAPSVVILDNGNPMNKVSSDGTVNWTGTTTITLSQAPNFNIFAF
jgi:translation elongation factor EF-1beta